MTDVKEGKVPVTEKNVNFCFTFLVVYYINMTILKVSSTI